MEVSVAPAQINLLSEQDLKERAIALLAYNDSHSVPAFPKLAGVVTNFLLERVTSIIWSLSADELCEWSKQRALARVIASISGGKLPERADAERPGNRMFEFVCRYRERRKRLVIAEKAAIYRARKAGRPQHDMKAVEARVSLDQALYHCKYGSTPAVLPVRRVPPGLRPQQVEFELSSIAHENMQLCRDNTYLRNLETEAIEMLERKLDNSKTEFTNSVASEYKALLTLDEQRDRTRDALHEVSNMASTVKAIKFEKKEAQVALEQKDRQIAVLGSKVARAHMDLVAEQRASELRKRKLEDSCEKQRQTNVELVMSLESSTSMFRNEYAKKDSECSYIVFRRKKSLRF